MNPASKGGKSLKKFKKILALLKEFNVDYNYELTKSLENARLLSKKANELNYDFIVAIGGDGTINSVLNGFYNDTGYRISLAKMGVIYTGTSPDFCKSYQIPLNLKKAVQILIDPYIRNIKIGKITCCEQNLSENDGKRISYSMQVKTKFFGCCVNVGLGASLAREANSGIRKYFGDTMGTFISLIKILLRYMANTFFIFKDNTEIKVDKLYNMSIGRTPFIASGIKVHHELSDDDDRFYCMTVRNLKFDNIPYVLYKAYSGGKIKNSAYLNLDYCNNIEILGNYQNPEVEFDGDPGGYLPCKIELSKSTLELITERPK